MTDKDALLNGGILSLFKYRNTFDGPDTTGCMDSSADKPTTEALDGINTDGISTAVIASVGSVMLALYFYYVRGDKQRGQFVGLWPTSILALASYFKLEEIKQALEDLEN